MATVSRSEITAGRTPVERRQRNPYRRLLSKPSSSRTARWVENNDLKYGSNGDGTVVNGVRKVFVLR